MELSASVAWELGSIVCVSTFGGLSLFLLIRVGLGLQVWSAGDQCCD